MLFAALAADSIWADTTYRPAEFDSNGELIVTSSQEQTDRGNGILQRGGYNPSAAEATAAARARTANPAAAAHIGNGNAVPVPQSEHNIYRCKNGKTDVFVDEDGKKRFSSCSIVRRGKNESSPLNKSGALRPGETADAREKTPQMKVLPLPDNADSVNADMPVAGSAVVRQPDVQPSAPDAQPLASGAVSAPCSGAVLYKGSTYIFSENEPCPIPDSIFRSRKPIEANPSYYTQ